METLDNYYLVCKVVKKMKISLACNYLSRGLMLLDTFFSSENESYKLVFPEKYLLNYH